jgi:hypothetical protein
MRQVVTSGVDLGPYGYNVSRASAFFDEVRGRLLGNPAVRSLGYSLDQGGMSGREATAWRDEQRALAAEGKFFFSVTQFCFAATRRAEQQVS